MSRSVPALLLSPLLLCCSDVRSMRRARDVNGLVSSLSAEEPEVRVKAIDALGQVGDSRAIGPLVRSLEDPDRYVREHAARNLGCNYHSTLGCDTAEARGPLVGVLDDPDPYVRLEAARSLGELRDPEAREPLEALARSASDQDVQREAILALGRLGDGRAGPLLEGFVDSAEPRIRAAAEEALRRLATARRRLPLGVEIEEVETRPAPDGDQPDSAPAEGSGEAGTQGPDESPGAAVRDRPGAGPAPA